MFENEKFCHGFDAPCSHIGKIRRQNTQYVDDERNWVFLCNECNKRNEEYWADMWREYYASVL